MMHISLIEVRERAEARVLRFISSQPSLLQFQRSLCVYVEVLLPPGAVSTSHLDAARTLKMETHLQWKKAGRSQQK